MFKEFVSSYLDSFQGVYKSLEDTFEKVSWPYDTLYVGLLDMHRTLLV